MSCRLRRSCVTSPACISWRRWKDSEDAGTSSASAMAPAASPSGPRCTRRRNTVSRVSWASEPSPARASTVVMTRFLEESNPECQGAVLLRGGAPVREAVSMEPVTPLTLQGQHVRLEPLGSGHLDGLQAIVEGPRDTFGLTPVPRTRGELEAYVATALEDQRRTMALPFATLDARSGRVVGTTRFGNLEFWPIPPGSTVPQRAPGVPYAVEIGWTWLAPDAQRTAINTEAKRLMLAHAFERWEAVSYTHLRAHE